MSFMCHSMNTIKCSRGGTGTLERLLVNLPSYICIWLALKYILFRIGAETSWRFILSCLLVDEYPMS